MKIFFDFGVSFSPEMHKDLESQDLTHPTCEKYTLYIFLQIVCVFIVVRACYYVFLSSKKLMNVSAIVVTHNILCAIKGWCSTNLAMHVV